MQKKRKQQINNKIKISSTFRTMLILFAVAIFAFSSGNIVNSLTARTQTITERKELYKYTNKFTSDSKINLKENKYVKDSEIAKNQTYLSDLISNIDMHMKYQYSDSKDAKITYNYKIEAIVKAEYSSNSTNYDVLNKVETLKEMNGETDGSQELLIDENIKVDYAKYHEMIKEFKQLMGINLKSTLYIQLTVDTKTKIDSKEIANQYVSKYNITLGDKIALIEENNNEEKSDSVKYDVQTNVNSDINKEEVIINAVFMFIGLILLRLILKKTEKLNSIRNEFKLELNRIMKSCESKIVEIEDLKQIDIEHATRVKDIEQLLKLSEEALVPIYCYIKEEPEEEAYFIVTKYERSYIFILR